MCLGFLTYNTRIQIMPGGLSGGVNEMRKIAGSTRVSSTERVAPTFLSLPFPTEIQCLVCQSCVPRSFFGLSDNSTARFPCSSSFLFPGFLFSIPPPPPPALLWTLQEVTEDRKLLHVCESRALGWERSWGKGQLAKWQQPGRRALALASDRN